MRFIRGFILSITGNMQCRVGMLSNLVLLAEFGGIICMDELAELLLFPVCCATDIGSLLRNDKSIRPKGLQENKLKENKHSKFEILTLSLQIWVIQEFLQA